MATRRTAHDPAPDGWPRLVVALDALLFLGFGLAFLIAPAPLLALLDIELHTPAALAEVRAMYGGLEIAIGGYLLAAVAGRVEQSSALMLAAASLAAMASVRIVSLLWMGELHVVLTLLTLAEVSGVVVNLIALRHVTRR